MHRLKEHLEQLAPSLLEKTTQNDYSDVELTPEESAEALRLGREKKFTELLKQEYWQKITAQKVAYRYTAKDLWNKLRDSYTSSGERFIIDDDNFTQVRMLCLYFAQDERVSEYGFSLDKGLYLSGGLGVGKSHLMSFFFQNQHQSYVMHSCRGLENRWHEGDADVIALMSKPITATVNGDTFGHQQLGVCFDDLGTETIPSKRYGEEKNVLAEIIMARYENKVPYTMTHITTNLNAADLTALYGDRIRDRLREMCNVITFGKTAKSRRK